MRISSTLSLYIGRHFLIAFTAIFFAFLALALTFDIVELLRRAAARPDIPTSMIFELALLRLPNVGLQMFPFAALFGGMVVFWRLTRSHELMVTRAAGVSAWQFLLPVVLLAFMLGIVKVTVISPLASTLLSRYERLQASLIEGRSNSLQVSEAGLWLRQSSDKGQAVIHAEHVLQQGQEVELSDVTVFVYEGLDKFIQRIDAKSAELQDGFWQLSEAWVQAPEHLPQFEPQLMLETDLTVGKIQDSFAPPETMSFWALPEFIRNLENAGFTALRHRLYWHSLLAAPLLMCAMILIAATFTLRFHRWGGTTFIVAGGVFTGFVLYFFSDLVFALGLSDSIPVTLAAWTPSGVATLLGIAMLLHLEDG
jgi:lipopolysaccharide export system permease protein